MPQWMAAPVCAWNALTSWTQWVIKKKKGSAGKIDQWLEHLLFLPKHLSLVPRTQIRISGFPTHTNSKVYTLKKINKKDRLGIWWCIF